MANDKRLKTIIPFLQQQGFVWGPSPELYGGVAGFYTYGPNGALLKRKVEEQIRKVFAKNQLFEVEVPTILPKIVWEASGHLGGFTDPLIRDKKGNVYRADHIVENFFRDSNINEPVPTDLLAAIKQHSIKSPANEDFEDKIVDHSLMMRTTIGFDTEAYARPETATATYLPFLRYVEHFRKKLPFGVYQIGKAYRNEISPRQHLLRMREFTQAEAQIFIDPDEKDNFPNYDTVKEHQVPIFSWDMQVAGEQAKNMSLQDARQELFSSNAYAFTVNLAYDLFKSFGIPEENIRLRQHGPDEKAFYAADAWDVEINLPCFGWTEVCGVHDRTDYDLSQHAKHSKQELNVHVEGKGKVIPHVLEIAFGVDRPVFALLDIFYDEQDAEAGKTMLKLPYHLAPVPVTVLPLTKKLSEKGMEVFNLLQNSGIVTTYDESGSIGKRYLRASTIGTPHCVTVDFDTLEDNSVTLRDRDSENQERVNINDLLSKLSS